jgi:hypothetical protein
MRYNHIKLDFQNNNILTSKKILLAHYEKFYNLIKSNLSYISGETLEIGSNDNGIKKIIKNCITSNFYFSKKIDRKLNVYKLKIKNNSISNFVMIDVFHHLKYPDFALQEINRKLKKKGKIIMIEPAMGLIPRIIYHFFHPEPNGLSLNIKWYNKPKKKDHLAKNNYFAAQGLSWRAFYKKELKLPIDLIIDKVEPFSHFAWIASGGYSFPSLYPSFFYKFVTKIDDVLTILSKEIFSAKMLIVLKKK